MCRSWWRGFIRNRQWRRRSGWRGWQPMSASPFPNPFPTTTRQTPYPPHNILRKKIKTFPAFATPQPLLPVAQPPSPDQKAPLHFAKFFMKPHSHRPVYKRRPQFTEPPNEAFPTASLTLLKTSNFETFYSHVFWWYLKLVWLVTVCECVYLCAC